MKINTDIEIKISYNNMNKHIQYVVQMKELKVIKKFKNEDIVEKITIKQKFLNINFFNNKL